MKIRTFKDEISNDPVAMCDFEEALLSSILFFSRNYI
jgi:hypothetical protein